MNSEQLLIDKWRSLNIVQQQEVLDFVEFIAQKSQQENQHSGFINSKRSTQAIHQYQARAQRVKQWLDWATDNPDDSPRLPDEALSRDSIYED